MTKTTMLVEDVPADEEEVEEYFRITPFGCWRIAVDGLGAELPWLRGRERTTRLYALIKDLVDVIAWQNRRASDLEERLHAIEVRLGTD